MDYVGTFSAMTLLIVLVITKSLESHKVTLLGIHIDRELKFDDHMYEKCNKAGNKLNALIRLCTILPFHKRRLLMMAFINPQFSYSPLVSLFYSSTLNNKINSLHYIQICLPGLVVIFSGTLE